MTESVGANNMYNSLIMYYKEHARKWQTSLYHPKIRTCILHFKEQLDCNPFLEVAVFFVIASLLVPILLFVIFATVSAIVAFVGFMMIQATILAIGASILSCILFCIASTFMMIGLYMSKHIKHVQTY